MTAQPLTDDDPRQGIRPAGCDIRTDSAVEIGSSEQRGRGGFPNRDVERVAHANASSDGLRIAEAPCEVAVNIGQVDLLRKLIGHGNDPQPPRRS